MEQEPQQTEILLGKMAFIKMIENMIWSILNGLDAFRNSVLNNSYNEFLEGYNKFYNLLDAEQKAKADFVKKYLEEQKK